MFQKYLDVIPAVTPMPDYDAKPESGWLGVKAIRYEGAAYLGKKTEVFAYYGYPENSENEKVPGIVLVHGGGGHAFAEWVKIWNDKGYAAIALDLRGKRPAPDKIGLAGTERHTAEWFEDMPTYGDYIPTPDGYCIYDKEKKIEDVWLYQAVANVILAHNVLRSDSRIDSTKIGITGISWGGIITSQVIGFDKRFAFAIPIYGSGYLNKSLSNICKPFTEEGADKVWNIGQRYDDIAFPVLWLCWNRDTAFDIRPNSMSYLKTKKSGSVLAIVDEMYHSHTRGWGAEESYCFADAVLNGKVNMTRPVEEPSGFGEVSFEISPADGVTATLYYLTEPMRYTDDSTPDYEWQTKPCEICGNRLKVTIPDDADNYYIAFRQERDGKILTSASAYICRD